jgi:hypothetical protein
VIQVLLSIGRAIFISGDAERLQQTFLTGLALMSRETPQLDIGLAHRHFSADCFNRTWTLIEKADRTPAETDAMVLCAIASLWHWTQRSDCTDQNLSIGHWQVSRVFAIAGQGENAMQHGLRCLALADGAPPFYVGYAHEAIARAAFVLDDRATFAVHMRQARACAAAIAGVEERGPLEQDLQALDALGGPVV